MSTFFDIAVNSVMVMAALGVLATVLVTLGNALAREGERAEDNSH
ncbi:MAG: hypothetical protein U5L04_14200 [Trueperaceae bacterium]|nr:hypothetical protein [Trueperaceae bacterium]